MFSSHTSQNSSLPKPRRDACRHFPTFPFLDHLWPNARVLELDEHLRAHVPKENAFDWLMHVGGQVHRAVKNRRTVEFHLGGRHYFIKAHRGVGWREVFKNWIYGRAPIVSAEPEWRAIAALNAAGVTTPSCAGKGLRGSAPASLESFIVMHALEGMISLEDLTKNWRGARGRTRVRLKLALIQQLARIARAMHGAGLNHRDFYLCHFLTRDRDWSQWTPADAVELTLIDLHRVQRRDAVPERWLVKDLGGLLFSALDAGITRRDLLRFVAAYRGQPWRAVLEQEDDFWKKVQTNARKLYRSVHRREPPPIP